MALQLDTAFVWVSEIDRSIDWYHMIGIEAGPRFGTWQTMSLAGDVRFALHEGDRPAGRSTAVLAFRIGDLDAAISRLAELGVFPIDERPTNTGVARFTTFLDPDGNAIQLLERTT